MATAGKPSSRVVQPFLRDTAADGSNISGGFAIKPETGLRTGMECSPEPSGEYFELFACVSNDGGTSTIDRSGLAAPTYILLP
jgi:hypothetical protein